MTKLRHDLAQEAARVMCEDRLTDYRVAKQKAAERLGLPPRTPMPDNAAVERALIEYQQLFGGDAYVQHLQRMRTAAVQAMRLLAEFSPRLVGGSISGAVTSAHRVQLHAFCDKPELLDIFLHDHGIAFEQDERAYRYPDGGEEKVALARFEADGVGVDIAEFTIDEQKRVPLNPADGHTFRRLDLRAAESLLVGAA